MLRYGPKGTFWAANPGTPKVPIRKWQVWNEQMAPWYWVPRPWAPTYVKLLKASYKAIHKADRKAKVIAGSLMSYGNYHQWDGVRDMYKRGGKRYFDEIALHPFTNDKSARVTANQTLEIVKRVRKVMSRNHDKRKPIEVTEMTWAAAKGIVPGNALFGMETTAKGQADTAEGQRTEAGPLPAQDEHHGRLLVHMGDRLPDRGQPLEHVLPLRRVGPL